jgi:hypothetical protein
MEIDRPIAAKDRGSTQEVGPRPGVPPSEEQRGIRLQRRSFLSMCAVAFCGDVLTGNVPEPPAVIWKEVTHAGGNRRWIAGDALRLKHFKDLYEAAKRR